MGFNNATTGTEVAAAYKASIEGKTIIITGVSPSSIGAAYAHALAPYAKTIIVASRSAERAEEAVKPIREENPRVDIQVVQLDLTSEASIRAAAAKIISFGHLIDVLINNAAPIVRDEKQAFTENQFEIQIGGSYFGHFLFTSLLFPRLLPTAGPEENRKPRVINVTSIAAFFNAPMRWDDIHFTKRPEDYDRYAAYNQSKTALGLFSVALAERFGKAGLLSFSADPGTVPGTNMHSTIPKEYFLSRGLMNEDGTYNMFTKTFDQGAASIIFAAFDPSIAAHNGEMIEDSALARESLPPQMKIPEYYTSPDEATKLWNVSEAAWGIKFGQSA